MRAAVALALFLSGSAAGSATTRPLGHAAAVQLFDSWKAPVAPRPLVGNIYYVGIAGVSSFLIATPAGHILIDTTFADTEPLVARGIQSLGFHLSDVKLILSSHAHVDHVGGHAKMKRETGARVVASAEDARILASGGAADFIPFPQDLIRYEPVTADRIVGDGEEVTLGGVTLTAHLTPGHTRGATTWTMNVRDGDRIYRALFFSSATISPGTRLLKGAPYATLATDYEQTFTKLKTLPCDIFFAPHADQFGMAAKFARLDRGEGVRVLVDPEGWRATIAQQEKAFRDELAAERAEK